jgi:prenyltransferase beta subunit
VWANAFQDGRLDAVASNDPERTGAEMITPDAQEAIDKGLAYLAAQQHEDGSFGSAGYNRNVAVCGLSGLAFMAAGSTPSRGPYGAQVEHTLEFVLASMQNDGFLVVPGTASHGPMYGHGFATLFLAECYGMTMRSDIRDKLQKAVKLIVDTQNQQGGWRYQPRKGDADISVTICQVMALRAARNAGIFVPKETIDRCTEYVKVSQNHDGGFMYMQEARGPSAFPRSAAGVVALYMAGIYDGDEIARGLKYLMQHLPNGAGGARESHYFYGQYYAAQAMWHAGGDFWRKWYPAIRDELIARQRPHDGAWQDSICNEYGTAMACIILQMPNNFLPIIQR